MESISIFPMLMVFIIFFILLKVLKGKKGNVNNRQTKAMKKMVDQFISLPIEKQNDFIAILSNSEEKNFDKFLDRVHDRGRVEPKMVNKSTIKVFQKLSKWYMKQNLEGQLQFFNLLKDDKKNQVLATMSKKEKIEFDRLQKLFKNSGEIPLNKVQVFTTAGIAQTLFIGMQPHFEQLRQIQDMVNNQQILDNQMLMDTLSQDLINQDLLNNQMLDQFAMDEAMKVITPFDHGGYMMGEGFNPSDTMAAEMNHQHDHSMDHHNHNL